jgi:serine/threonine-protein phosphatase 2B regulatory subunit|eukprot:gnl/Ergobibamus_cyprinoides/709.p2 GENE.gnl/Ergobibamus_cyprinoides/709~~gnl/Ergobibamus_cyprinoides/709.p2  ORF type:complete len:215 (+),score=52.73 gnl/Ergobibamus_cyprinoides/709:99-647(+)
MGASHSLALLSASDLEELQLASNFTQNEIKRLYKRFRRLDKDGSGTISAEEFLMIPELCMNPLANRVIAIFDENRDDSVNFREFITALSVFSARGDREDKLKFAFRVYDIDGDGEISNGELFQVLKMMTGDHLSDVQLQQVVDKTIMQADRSGSGSINFEEFCSVLAPSEGGRLETMMTIRF